MEPFQTQPPFLPPEAALDDAQKFLFVRAICRGFPVFSDSIRSSTRIFNGKDGALDLASSYCTSFLSAEEMVEFADKYPSIIFSPKQTSSRCDEKRAHIIRSSPRTTGASNDVSEASFEQTTIRVILASDTMIEGWHDADERRFTLEVDSTIHTALLRSLIASRSCQPVEKLRLLLRSSDSDGKTSQSIPLSNSTTLAIGMRKLRSSKREFVVEVHSKKRGGKKTGQGWLAKMKQCRFYPGSRDCINHINSTKETISIEHMLYLVSCMDCNVFIVQKSPIIEFLVNELGKLFLCWSGRSLSGSRTSATSIILVSDKNESLKQVKFALVDDENIHEVCSSLLIRESNDLLIVDGDRSCESDVLLGALRTITTSSYGKSLLVLRHEILPMREFHNLKACGMPRERDEKNQLLCPWLEINGVERNSDGSLTTTWDVVRSEHGNYCSRGIGTNRQSWIDHICVDMPFSITSSGDAIVKDIRQQLRFAIGFQGCFQTCFKRLRLVGTSKELLANAQRICVLSEPDGRDLSKALTLSTSLKDEGGMIKVSCTNLAGEEVFGMDLQPDCTLGMLRGLIRKSRRMICSLQLLSEGGDVLRNNTHTLSSVHMTAPQ